jgi:Na+/glutamate symporter
MDDLLPFALAVAAFGIVGVVIGMLVAPRLERMTEPKDEDAGDGDD